MLELDSVITNGYVAPDTMAWYTERGWTFVCTVPAKLAHPYAMDTDKLSLFSKYTELEKNDPSKTCESAEAL